jgi:hypothetical protein
MKLLRSILGSFFIARDFGYMWDQPGMFPLEWVLS